MNLIEFKKKNINKRLLNSLKHTQLFKNNICISRDFEIYLIVGNVITNQNTIIVATLGFRRTSLLNFIKDALIQFFLLNYSNKFYLMYIDLSSLASDKRYSPASFWKTLETTIEKKYLH